MNSTLKMSIKFAETNFEIEKCFNVMKQLRTHLKSKTEFLERVLLMKKTEKFNLVFYEENEVILCVAGIREMNKLYDGKTIYVDDLITNTESRSKGCGTKMIEYLKRYVKENGFDGLTLDSGLQRNEAHHFYFKNNLYVSSFHFVCKL